MMQISNDYVIMGLPIVIFLLVFLIWNFSKPIRKFEFDLDSKKIILTLRNHSVEEVKFGEIKRIEYSGIMTRRRQPYYFVSTPYGVISSRGIHSPYSPHIEEIIKSSGMKQRRKLTGELIWEKVDGYAPTKEDLNFSFVRAKTFIPLFVALFFGIIGIIVCLYYYNLAQEVVK